MNAAQTNPPLDAPRPRTVTVLGFLVTTAFVLSYLSSYALTNALLARDVLAHWAPGADPRPRWLALTFVSLLALFGVAGWVIRHASSRQLRSIDALADDTEEFRISDA
jgi:hypothetical protein